jgi:predicted ribosomally synthesized peptide with nif11-like leader
MSKEQLEGFLAKVEKDEDLKNELRSGRDAGARPCVVAAALATKAGFDVSESDVQELENELSDETLEHVAGGAKQRRPPTDSNSGYGIIWARLTGDNQRKPR